MCDVRGSRCHPVTYSVSERTRHFQEFDVKIHFTYLHYECMIKERYKMEPHSIADICSFSTLIKKFTVKVAPREALNTAKQEEKIHRWSVSGNVHC